MRPEQAKRARRFGVWIVVVCLVVLIAGAVAAATPADRVLVVSDAKTGERLRSMPVENGTVVAIEYTHSVEKSRVLDVYAVQGDRLVMTRMEFETYGWGLPADVPVSTDNETFVFDPAFASDEFVVKPGRIAGHTLHVRNSTYDLVALSDARAVRLSVERRSALRAALDVLDNYTNTISSHQI